MGEKSIAFFLSRPPPLFPLPSSPSPCPLLLSPPFVPPSPPPSFVPIPLSPSCRPPPLLVPQHPQVERHEKCLFLRFSYEKVNNVITAEPVTNVTKLSAFCCPIWYQREIIFFLLLCFAHCQCVFKSAKDMLRYPKKKSDSSVS